MRQESNKLFWIFLPFSHTMWPLLSASQNFPQLKAQLFVGGSFVSLMYSNIREWDRNKNIIILCTDGATQCVYVYFKIIDSTPYDHVFRIRF